MIAIARQCDIPLVMEIIEEARRFQLSYGNGQWAGGYPSLSLIEEDVEKGIGYCFYTEGQLAGYMAITDHDEAYSAIEGAWLTAGPYLAVHRLAFADAFRGRGLFENLVTDLVDHCKAQGVHSLRMDTDRRNPIMQHLLDKLGFVFTGYVIFDNDKKLAYELVLQ